jgi:hypothetical protein
MGRRMEGSKYGLVREHREGEFEDALCFARGGVNMVSVSLPLSTRK